MKNAPTRFFTVEGVFLLFLLALLQILLLFDSKSLYLPLKINLYSESINGATKNKLINLTKIHWHYCFACLKA